jgi:hypothetical protein
MELDTESTTFRIQLPTNLRTKNTEFVQKQRPSQKSKINNRNRSVDLILLSPKSINLTAVNIGFFYIFFLSMVAFFGNSEEILSFHGKDNNVYF